MLKDIPPSLITSVKSVLKTSSEKLKEQEQRDKERLIKLKQDTDSIMEKLVGNQHKLDKNKNKKIDSEDLKILRGQKTAMESMDSEREDDKEEMGDEYKGKKSSKKHKMSEDVEQVVEGKRLISKHGEGVHTAKVYKDSEYGEYQVHFFKDGKHMGEGPVSYHDDKEDAQKTADHALKKMNEEKDTPGNSYSHQCAVHVKHSKLGEGKTLYSQHAEPDSDGNIAWYDVMFDEGIKRVETKDLEILVSEAHKNHKKM